jgi:hypothetical protein
VKSILEDEREGRFDMDLGVTLRLLIVSTLVCPTVSAQSGQAQTADDEGRIFLSGDNAGTATARKNRGWQEGAALSQGSLSEALVGDHVGVNSKHLRQLRAKLAMPSSDTLLRLGQMSAGEVTPSTYWGFTPLNVGAGPLTASFQKQPSSAKGRKVGTIALATAGFALVTTAIVRAANERNKLPDTPECRVGGNVPACAAQDRSPQTTMIATAGLGLVLAALVLESTDRPPVNATPSALDFHRVGRAAQGDLKLIIRGRENVDITVDHISVSGNAFSLVGAPTVPLTIGPNGDLEITVRFQPPSVGKHTGKLELSSFVGSTKPRILRVSLSGRGT